MNVRRELRRFEHHGEPLADADADRGDAPAMAAALHLVGQPAEDADARGAERMADGDRAAVGVDLRGVQAVLGPLADVGEALGGEGLVELDAVDVAPPDAGALQGYVRGRDRADAEDVGVAPPRAAAGDAGERLAAERGG